MAGIEERLNDPDNIEIIRDQISAILAVEMQHQYELAQEESDPVADDYKVTVLVENDEPLQAGVDGDLLPLINISVDTVKQDKGVSVNGSTRTATINIDCYQIGNRAGKFAGRNAVVKAWKLARCVRAILESDYYTYLFLRGVVSRRQILSMQGGFPAGMENSAVKVGIIRIVLEVNYDQKAPATSGPGIEIMPIVISDDNGQVVIQIE